MKIITVQAADQAGLQEGDHILKVTDGTDVLEPETQYDLLEWIQYHPEELQATVQRQDEVFEVSIQPEKDEETNTYLTLLQMKYANYFKYAKAVLFGNRSADSSR